MKPSSLINDLVKYISKYGDNEDIKIDLLTENQSNIVNITGIRVYNDVFYIESDIENIKEFKKSIK